VREPRGIGGFGYDPHFYLEAQGVTAAELPAELKNRLSHRAQAVRRLLEMLAPGS
jgi:XTP/dITP diphosphohydrolase